MLEEQGIVGAADGAKPREIFGDKNSISNVELVPGGGTDESEELPKVSAEEDDDEWKKV
jgi:hypothetical protein